ncbi:lysosome-associated membrane glycoprotein 1-like [Mizuhopecten yessoensis]|uniref:Lysosome-associated membrane glycoprotein 5 n=1 Tax=Mizuhopecten yessoensis TaxID=6573 RepID=A0A210R797_MIZYE|nr:lysosome-associated membrane glycoprotein 1-like [Mizuhopecten yessoensis]OWF56865.1 Lysosome-associated membrane glycoprotein 1 [Mizuhopecten yessoensis]
MRSYMYTGIACILLSSLSIVSSVEWDFVPQGQTACLKVNWDVTKMDLTGAPNSGEGDKHSIDWTTGVVNNKSKCATNGGIGILNVDFDKGITMSLTFITDSNKVTMDGTLTFVPFNVFEKPEFGNTTATLTMASTLALSADDKSFTCISPLRLMFNTATANNTYQLDMQVDKTQIQAFGITNGDFSEGTPCEADTSNSTATTEVPVTSAAPNVTTEKPTTEKPTTEAPTTAPPSAASMYYYPNKTDPCIIVAGDFEISVTYTKMDNTTSNVPLKIPADAKVNGSCPEGMKSEISMTWGGSGAMRMVRMSFSSSNDIVDISTISLDVDLDNTTFPESKDADMKADFPTSIPLSKPTGYYKCKANVDVPLGTSKLSMSDVAIQAFNVNGTSFTGEREECAADKPVTTEPPVTTPAPVTPAPGSPPVNKYTVPGNCIVLDAGLEFVIPYTKSDNTSTSVTVGIPKNYTATGTCGNVTQMLNVVFYEDWSMEMIFNGGGSASQLSDSDSFFLEELRLSYKLQPNIFAGVKNPNAEMVANNTFDKSQFSAKKTGSYQCNNKLNFGLNNGVTLNTDDLQVKAFSTDNSTGFPTGDLNECPQDSDTNSVVPIAVGAALAGLVVIVLIAYLIGRRRSRSGYQQV